MLSRSEECDFLEYTSRWLRFAETYDDEHLTKIRESVELLYSNLRLDAPQVIPLKGPVEQLIFPCLIGLLLKEGQNAHKTFKLAGLQNEYFDVRRAWRTIWEDAYSLIDWSQIPTDSKMETTGVLLNKKIRESLNRTLRSRLKLKIDECIDVERHLQLEEMVDNQLREPQQRARAILIPEDTRVTTIWRSFKHRLTQQSLEQLREMDKVETCMVAPVSDAWLGASEFYWLACCDFARNYLPVELDEALNQELDMWTTLFLGATAYLFCENFCFVFLKPAEIRLDDQWRPHSGESPSVKFIDGTTLFHWHGIDIPEELIENPRKLTIKRIFAEGNVEVRRALIEIYGLEQFLNHASAKKIHEDEYGALYSRDMPGDEPLVVVRVLNSTPELDGTYKTYFLRVPPTTRTAKAGVAWTFGLNPHEYKPNKET